ncbi:DUF2771 domain-containing protein [Actinopolyspora erythraea]|uniref:DUF2771 domain-containing protein n=1 Tax=Actinopolyspora erythraea TaxID=414996 RepID=A0A099D379_9ACTN|nr:DUF2771 family protein [Actinopolyspora erythraea]ASU77394.1 DUF2771 domain-containing protein [Actinopolyspora erythraea]KGI80391.1 hypothetical protein IL38_18260 [Actinopolyspora erythraea]
MRRGLTALLVLTALSLAGCAAPEKPSVTFYSHGESVRVSPVQYCERLARECQRPAPEAAGELPMPPEYPLQISVSEEIASTPWQVVFTYRGESGERLRGRSGVMGSEEARHAYTLRLPEDGARLERVEVQRYGTVSVNQTGQLQFVIGGTWVVGNSPQQDPRTS